MMILRDKQLSTQKTKKILDLLQVKGEILTWDNGQDPLYGNPPDRILFISSMESGWLGYHQEFIRAHRKDVAEWIVIVLNNDPVSIEQTRMGFAVTSAAVRLFAHSENDAAYWIEAGKQIAQLVRIQAKKALIYSIHPRCGKRTIAGILARHLPEWLFETADENSCSDALRTTDAAQIIIVGKRLEELAVDIPQGRQPYFVLTMADKDIQTYLQPSLLPGLVQAHLPSQLNWTREKVKSRFFFTCPLYEFWRESQTDPRLDERFVMWDSYGLPVVHHSVDTQAIQHFIAQFDQCRQLAHAMAR